ncbi:hypothetical protein D8S78_02245 [Natrialba swarupiae]|nr:hypothetical protein [Natrialba swarupiae]
MELEERYDRAVRDVFRDLLERYVDRTATIGGDSDQPPIPSFASVAASGTHSSSSASTPLETDVPPSPREQPPGSSLRVDARVRTRDRRERAAGRGEYAPVREDVEGREGSAPATST